MDQLSCRRHRFPPAVIQHAIWLYLRFTLSYRDVEELLAERGLDVSYETVRRWVLKFGPGIARKLRQCRPPSDRWHLDEMVVRISGKRMDQSTRALGSVKAVAEDSCTNSTRTAAVPRAITVTAKHATMKPRMSVLQLPRKIQRTCPEVGSVKPLVSISTNVRPSAPTHA